MHVKKTNRNKMNNKNSKNKFTSCESAKFTGVYSSINFNSNDNAEKKCALLQQNLKLSSKLKEISMKMPFYWIVTQISKQCAMKIA